MAIHSNADITAKLTKNSTAAKTLAISATEVVTEQTISAVAAPVQSAGTANASGGSMANGAVYKYYVTALDSHGRESALSNEITVTCAAGGGINSNNVNWAAVTGATGGYNIYKTAAGGGSNTESFV